VGVGLAADAETAWLFPAVVEGALPTLEGEGVGAVPVDCCVATWLGTVWLTVAPEAVAGGGVPA
jgi:hypothetical protein